MISIDDVIEQVGGGCVLEWRYSIRARSKVIHRTVQPEIAKEDYVRTPEMVRGYSKDDRTRISRLIHMDANKGSGEYWVYQEENKITTSGRLKQQQLLGWQDLRKVELLHPPVFLESHYLLHQSVVLDLDEIYETWRNKLIGCKQTTIYSISR